MCAMASLICCLRRLLREVVATEEVDIVVDCGSRLLAGGGLTGLS